MNEWDDVRSSLMLKWRYYIHERVCVLEEYYSYNDYASIYNSLIMPIALDQWGWEEADAVLYIGIVMVAGGVMAGFCYASIGPLAKRFDERLIMFFCGIVPMVVGRFIVFPTGDTYPMFKGNASDVCPGVVDPNAPPQCKYSTKENRASWIPWLSKSIAPNMYLFVVLLWSQDD